MTLLIGIAGRMRTGKSTLAVMLRSRLLNRFHKDNIVCIESFAEALRQEVAEIIWKKLDPTSARYLLSVHEDEHKESIRPLLQAWGQAKRDLLHIDYWVDALSKTVSMRSCDFCIVDDVRHQNEADYILRNGGILIRLNANTATLKERGANPDRLAHYSENAMNSPSQEELRRPHRVLNLNTGGMSPHGMVKALFPFVEEMIIEEMKGEEE